MASLGVNVLRYTALGTGAFYGVTHQLSLNSAGRIAQEKHEYEAKQHQIEEARKAWQSKNAPSSGVISDPEHPQFDLEKWIKSHEGQKA